MPEPEELSIEKYTQPLPSSYSENSLQELEEFHDPFSDISLFLSQKITTEIAAHGSSQEWSAQIEQDLLRKILPEFKARFPRYRLGLFALKKAFEKVAYFYDKLYSHKNFDANALIRENIGHQMEVGIYNSITGVSEQIAQNVGECLATLEGKKPNMLSLMAKSYATLKSLQLDISAHNPFYSYDARDSLIVKTQIETIAEHPTISFRQLQAVVEQKLHTLFELPAPHKNHSLETHIACHLGKKWAQTLKLQLCETELSTLRNIIEREFYSGNPAPKIARHVEMLLQLAKSCYGNHPPLHLFDLYQQEIVQEFEESGYSETQVQIEQISSLKKFLELPTSDTTATVWALISKLQTPPPPLLQDLVENEIVTVIRSSEKEDFYGIVQSTLLAFKKAKELLEEQEGLEEKIEFWALQGELVFLDLNLPQRSTKPLSRELKGFAAEWKKREWIYDRWNAYKNASGTPLERYLSLHEHSTVRERLPLFPEHNADGNNRKR